MTVGAGLQVANYTYLSGSHHPTVTIHLVSADPTKLLLAPNDTTPGTATLDVVLPNGTDYFYYYAQGVEQKTGVVSVTATATGFTGSSASQTVVQPGEEIVYLPTTTSVANGSYAMAVRVGIMGGGNTYISSVQNVRPGSGYTATVTSSNAAAGLIENSAGTAASLTVLIPPRSYESPYGSGSGGVSFKPVAPGSTTVTATIPNVFSLPTATVPVTVNN
jgi:hypothetical protein